MLSVVIPIYRVEKYIKRCIVSLFEQTLVDIQYIFVNDCTDDDSVNILLKTIEDYPNRKNQIKLINHEQNRGLAKARTSGMMAADGDYIISCDSDDWVDKRAYELMYQTALKNNADVVTCRYISEYGNNINHEQDNKIGGPIFTGRGIDALRSINFSYQVWNKMIKSLIIRKYNIFPYEGFNYGEDLNVTLRVLFHADRVVGLPDPFYHYFRNNPNSYCNDDFFLNTTNFIVPQVEMIDTYYKKFIGNEDMSMFMNHLKFLLKERLLTPPRDTKTWSHLWPECHKDIINLPDKFDSNYKQFLNMFANYPLILDFGFRLFEAWSALKGKCEFRFNGGIS